MQTLNLSYPELSPLKYIKTKYADSQVSIELTNLRGDADDPVFIISRFNSYEDLFYILAATEVLKHRGKQQIYLAVSSFLGQRSDQRFGPFKSFDLRIITDIINAQGYRNVMINTPHSPVLPALLKNCMALKDEDLLNFALEQLTNLGWYDKNLILVSPDAGAYKKVAKLALDKNIPCVAAVKYRINGVPKVSLVGGSESDLPLMADKTAVILDDYCDGGRTFIALAEQLRTAGAKRVILVVAHGLFSQGLDVLKNGGIDRIICTNSISDIGTGSTGYGTTDWSNFVIQQDIFKSQD